MKTYQDRILEKEDEEMRTFIAVEISEELRKKIEELQKELPEGLKLVDPKNIHITLKFLGEVDESKIPEVKGVIARVSFSPFIVKAKGVGVFPSEKYIKVVWIGAEEDEGLKKLKEIAEEIDRKTVELGLPKADYPFSMHITIARVKQKTDLSDFLSKHKEEEFGEFKVEQIKLKKSTLTPKGPIYEDL